MILMPLKVWEPLWLLISMSGVETENMYFWQVLRWWFFCSSTLRTTAMEEVSSLLSSIQTSFHCLALPIMSFLAWWPGDWLWNSGTAIACSVFLSCSHFSSVNRTLHFQAQHDLLVGARERTLDGEERNVRWSIYRWVTRNWEGWAVVRCFPVSRWKLKSF